MKRSRSWLLALAVIITLSESVLGFIQERSPNGAARVRWNLLAEQPNVTGGKVVYVIKSAAAMTWFSATLPRRSTLRSLRGGWRTSRSSTSCGRPTRRRLLKGRGRIAWIV